MLGLDNAGKTTLLYALKVRRCFGGARSDWRAAARGGCDDGTHHRLQHGRDSGCVARHAFELTLCDARAAQIGNNLTVSVWDIGGQSKLRQLWKHYYLGTGLLRSSCPGPFFDGCAVAIILVVDCNDHERLGEVRAELEVCVVCAVLFLFTRRCVCVCSGCVWTLT